MLTLLHPGLGLGPSLWDLFGLVVGPSLWDLVVGGSYRVPVGSAVRIVSRLVHKCQRHVPNKAQGGAPISAANGAQPWDRGAIVTRSPNGAAPSGALNGAAIIFVFATMKR